MGRGKVATAFGWVSSRGVSFIIPTQGSAGSDRRAAHHEPSRGSPGHPLLRFDLVEGRSDEELKTLLDAAHRAMLAAFKVPERDRYQIVHEHPAGRMIVEDTGLDIARTDKVVVLQVTTRPRPREQKEAFYRALVEELEASCGIAPSDVVVSPNSDEDWSFGLGRGQFLTREL